MPPISARQIGTTALRLLGVASAEQPLSADMAQSALEALNTLLDAWSTERLLTWTRPRILLQLVPSKDQYSWGLVAGETTPADIPHPAPVRLEIALVHIGGSPAEEWPLQILTQEDYENLVWFKTLESSYVECVYLEDTVPYNVLHVYPVPTGGHTLILLPWQAHSPYASWDAVLEWPAGYQRAFTANLAIELAPQYGVEPSPTLLRMADESKRALYPVNLEMGYLRLDPRRRVGVAGLGYNADFLAGR
jgi:hypothetical protein